MNRPHRRLSELSSNELRGRAMHCRHMALDTNDPGMIKSLNVLAARYAMLVARREMDEASSNRKATASGSSEVDRLARLAKQAASTVLDPVRGLADAIMVTAESEADPYLTMGVLVEGAVHTLTHRIPEGSQQVTASALLRILIDRLKVAGLQLRE
jgi:hypothetical protein